MTARPLPIASNEKGGDRRWDASLAAAGTRCSYSSTHGTCRRRATKQVLRCYPASMARPSQLLCAAVLALLLPGLTACSGRKDDKARAALHDAGFSYTVEEFVRAATEGREEIVRNFLDAGMTPDAATSAKATPIAAAAAAGHGHIVTLLRSRGALPDGLSPAGQEALMAAAKSGDAESVKALLSAGADARGCDGEGLSPLSLAVLAGHALIVTMLADHSPGPLDDSLQLAALKGHAEVLSVLMDRGASPHSVSVDGRTPMMFAAQYGHASAVKLLRQRGGSVTALDENLKTPADYAEENAHAELAAYLREPDNSADPVPLDTAPVPVSEVDRTTLPGELPALAEIMEIMDYRTSSLPIVVMSVAEDSGSAEVRILPRNEPPVVVQTGEEIPGTGLTIERLRHRMVPAKGGLGRLIDASEMMVRDAATGRRHMAVKGLPVMAGEPMALIRFTGAYVLHEVRPGDLFTAGQSPVRVLDVRPTQIVIERTDTRETATVFMSR